MVISSRYGDGGLHYDVTSKVVTTTRIFEFACAHNLQHHHGKCRFFHGHNYKMHVTVAPLLNSTPNTDKSQLGMVTDFGNLKKIVNEIIIDKYDHSLMIWSDDPSLEGCKLIKDIKNLIFDSSDHDLDRSNIHIVPYRPTAENMVVHFFDMLEAPLKDRLNVKLVSIRIYETDNSYAECIHRS